MDHNSFFAFFMGAMAGWAFYEWLIIGLCVLLLFPFTEYEKGGWIFVTLVVMAIFGYFASGGHMLIAIRDNPIDSLGWFTGYFFVGACWSLFKWDRLGRAFRLRFNTFKSDFTKSWRQELASATESTRVKNLGRLTDEVKRRMLGELANNQVPSELYVYWRERTPNKSSSEAIMKPSPFTMKSTITTWIGFWPWSMVNYLFFKLLADLVNAIWRSLVKLYTMISDRHYKDVDPRLLEEQD